MVLIRDPISVACVQGDDSSALPRMMRHCLSLHPDSRDQGDSYAH
jgi:hypothetical protein